MFFILKSVVKKIVITGPESTGKSTIAASLAQHYQTEFVPEYAREYLNALKEDYQYEDLLEIAKGQIALENEVSKRAKNGLLFCDTDLFVLKVWSEHRFKKCHPWILGQIKKRHYDYYFLTDIDFPWVSDPLREHPEVEMRAYFFNSYLQLLKKNDLPFSILNGNEEQRLKKAIEVLDSLE